MLKYVSDKKSTDGGRIRDEAGDQNLDDKRGKKMVRSQDRLGG